MSRTFGPIAEPSDEARILDQMNRVRNHLLASAILNRWETLEEICAALEKLYPGERFPEASISAQIRHLRKPRFGGYDVQRQWKKDIRISEYRIVAPARREAEQLELIGRTA
jgi:hypothetical protein